MSTPEKWVEQLKERQGKTGLPSTCYQPDTSPLKPRRKEAEVKKREEGCGVGELGGVKKAQEVDKQGVAH